MCVSSVHVCLHLWYLSGLGVNTLFVGQHKWISLYVSVIVCILLEDIFREQPLYKYALITEDEEGFTCSKLFELSGTGQTVSSFKSPVIVLVVFNSLLTEASLQPSSL